MFSEEFKANHGLTTERMEQAFSAVQNATRELAIAKDNLQDAKTEFAAASLEAAQSAPHPLAGRTVKRTYTQTGRGSVWSRTRAPDRQVTQTGVVQLAGIGDTYYRNHSPKAGEWFVASVSGHTAYRLTDDWTAA